MAPNDDNQLERIFHEALERGPAAERTAYLDGACGDDLHLRARVEVLLRAHAEAEGFLEEGVVNPAAAVISEGPGSRIGHFKLLQKIGEGGMGAVYMAEQQRPVQRKVALKIIKLGMDTKQVIARFEAERQALAMMDHPGIAKVLDAGATETGRPYFVMELVRGVSISEYCDTHNLRTRERLTLFIEVCHAIQHAHQKGIIHRDIKPSNVLVTSHDGRPVPKIIDFGVAKATNQRLTEMTLFTEFHQFIGTPEYMSPEQAEMSGLDVDTRSDIYSLGVLLYHLLTGTTPVDAKTLRDAGYQNMQRIIREQEATAPSTLISKMGDASTTVAKHRGTEPGVLASLFRGDLDWIVMKALEKDRTRRYETVSAMADDVRRHLDNHPVLAGRPSALYKLRKFVRRNRVPVLAGSVASLAILIGLAAAVTGFWRARTAALRSQMISDTLQELLISVDPGQAASYSVDVERVLQRARDAFGDGHATVAATLNSLAVQLHNSGDFEGAEPLYRESLRIWEEIHGRNHLNVALTLGHLGSALRSRGEVEEAEANLRAALAILDTLPMAPPLASCPIRIELAEVLGGRGERDEAAQLYQRVIDIYDDSPETSRYLLIQTLEQYLHVLLSGEDKSEVLEVLTRVYDEVRLAYADGSPYHVASSVGLANWLYQMGQEEDAARYFREGLACMERDPEAHPVYRIMALDRMFQILRKRTDSAGMAEADAILAECIVHLAPSWSPEELIQNLDHLAERYRSRGLFVEALEPALQALQVAREKRLDPRSSARLGDKLAADALYIAMRPGREPSTYALAHRTIDESLAWLPDEPHFVVALAGLLFRMGHPGNAEDLLAGLDPRDTLRLAPIRPALSGFNALILHALGEEEAAASHLADLIESESNAHHLDRDSLRAFSREVRDTLNRRD